MTRGYSVSYKGAGDVEQDATPASRAKHAPATQKGNPYTAGNFYTGLLAGRPLRGIRTRSYYYTPEVNRLPAIKCIRRESVLLYPGTGMCNPYARIPVTGEYNISFYYKASYRNDHSAR